MSTRRFFYDTEFIEDGETIQLVSIGIVAEDGAEYAAVSNDFDASKAIPWVKENVLALLPPITEPRWKPRDRIRDEVEEFLTAGPGTPELWAWFGAYDHVALCQLFGAMPALPRAIPRYTRELRQLWETVGEPSLPKQETGRHDSLEDARFARRIFQLLQDHARRPDFKPVLP